MKCSGSVSFCKTRQKVSVGVFVVAMPRFLYYYHIVLRVVRQLALLLSFLFSWAKAIITKAYITFEWIKSIRSIQNCVWYKLFKTISSGICWNGELHFNGSRLLIYTFQLSAADCLWRKHASIAKTPYNINTNDQRRIECWSHSKWIKWK